MGNKDRADPISINMIFENEEARRFAEVKKYRGCKLFTELIRILVSDEYNEIQRRLSAKLAEAIPPRELAAK